jgi:hypothetical protein
VGTDKIKPPTLCSHLHVPEEIGLIPTTFGDCGYSFAGDGALTPLEASLWLSVVSSTVLFTATQVPWILTTG